MSAPRISRGPMAAEVLGRDYTQVSNQLWRDPRIHAKSKGIFGFLASHRDGFGVSPESIAAAMADGLSAVKSALRELEDHGYLTRSQTRTTDGTMGDTTYRITDMPSSEPVDGNRPPVATSNDKKTRRSEPVDGNPLAVKPPADDRPHKKTIPSKKISSEEKTTSPSPAEPTEPPAAPGDTKGGGGGSDLRSTAERITASLDYQGQLPDKQQRKTLTARLLAALEAGWSEDGLAVYLYLGRYRPDCPAAFYIAKLAPDRLPDPEPVAAVPSLGGIFAPLPTGAEIEALELDDVFGPARQDVAPEGIWEGATARARQRMGAGHRPFECPPASAYTGRGFGSGGGTDERVSAHAALTAHLRAAEAAEADRPPHCGDWYCDPYTRTREEDIDNGLKVAVKCPTCHPDTR